MKRLHIALLVLAGALGGAIVMNVAQRSRTVAPAPVAARSQAPAQAAPAAAPAPVPAPPETPPAVAAAPPEPEKPSPVAKRAAPRPRRARSASPARNPEPVAIAQNVAPISTAPAAQNAPAPAPEPPQETSAPEAAPARPAPENVTPAAIPIAPPPPNQVTLKPGMLIPVRLVDGLSSERNNPGDAFTATLDKELVVDGFVIAERGARAEGRVAASDRGGKVKGVATLTVELTRLDTSDGQVIAVQTDGFEKRAEPNLREDAAKIGAGAVVGAAIGAVAGGGKGAAIGAGAGGGVGAGDVLLTRGKPATLPSETRISFRLNAPLTITERR